MDKFSKEARSQIMASVKSKNSKAELLVRSELHKMGYRFRLHDKKLTGKPDIILPKYKTIIFVHGCFWHRHSCKRATAPSSNVEYWRRKFARNIARFETVKKILEADGWRVEIIWECEIKDASALTAKLQKILSPA